MLERCREMANENNIKDAIDSFVKSLQEEQENGKLMENDKLKELEKAEEVSGLEKIAKIVKKTIDTICLGEDVEVKINREDLRLSVYGNDLAIAIGRNGKNIEALEYLINLISARQKLVKKNVILDIKDYRKKKAERIKKTAIKLAKKAIRKGKKIKLRPMNSFERKIIHNALSNFKDVKTISKNKEPNRRIVIYPFGKSS